MVQVKTIKKTKQYLVASIIPLLFPFYIIILTIYVAGISKSHAFRRETFFSFFPSFLQSSFYLPLTGILCCMIAGLLSFIALPTNNTWLQILASLIMAISAIITGWFIFALM
jgi:uncharacterized membrane protein (GlpM family)